MSSLRRLTALAIARAMLAGPQQARGLAARTAACLAAPAQWQEALAERLCRMPGELWKRLTTRSLASLVERDVGYAQAWSSPTPPSARRYILRPRGRLNALPLGLERCQIPNWLDSGALARWLELSSGGLWRLTKPTSWQRRAPLGQQHYHYQLLAKPSGGWRLLEVPLPYLRCLQRRVLDDLLDRIPRHEACCGFTRERSVIDHARAHAGQAVVLKFDLQDFFASVRASRVHALFATLGYPEEVVRELTCLCTTAAPEPVLRRMHEAGQLTWTQLQRLRDPHLPQGAPTSPALANLCAFRLDLRLDGLAYVLGARYTRYADDLVFSGGEHLRRVALRIEKWVGKIAIEEGFVLNHRKTRCLPRGQRQTVCGVVVNERPNLPREEFDRLKAILHQCVVAGPRSQNRDGVDHWRETLRGKVGWAQQLNPAKAAKLKSMYDRIDWSR